MNQWNAIADYYDKWMGDDGDVLHKNYIDPIILSWLEDLNNPTVLDAGCGNGYLLTKLSKQSKQVVGVDFSDTLLDIAAKRIENCDNVIIKKSNIEEQIPFHDNSYDVIIASMVVQYLEHIDFLAEEMFRILKSDGRILIVLDHPAHALAERIKMLNGQQSEKFIDLHSYFQSGKRKKRSLGTTVEIEYYHRTMSEYLNAFCKYFRLNESVEKSEDGETPRIWGLRFTK